jgi:hypothetical protein
MTGYVPKSGRYERAEVPVINPKFEKLTTSLRTAISDDLGKLDKEATSYDNVLDAFRLSLQMFKLKTERKICMYYRLLLKTKTRG